MSLFNFKATIIADYLTDPANQRELAAFARTEEGRNLVGSFMKSKEGREFLRSLVPVLLDFLAVPEETKKTVIAAIPAN